MGDYSQEYTIVKKQKNDGTLLCPMEIQMESDSGKLKDYLKKQKNPDAELKTYLEARIEASEHFEKLRANKSHNKGPAAKLIQQDGKEILDLDVPRNQTAGNGCWSVALGMMLKSRGVDLPQEVIRAYRSPYAEKNKPEIQRNYTADSGAELAERMDLIADVLPNTLVRSRQYGVGVRDFDRKTRRMKFQLPSEETKQKLSDALFDDIRSAVTEKNSPVFLRIDGHIRTVVGVDAKNKAILFKDSMERPVNATFSCTADDMVERVKDNLLNGGNISEITLGWLEDIDPAEGVKLDKTLEYQKDDKGNLTLPEADKQKKNFRDVNLIPKAADGISCMESVYLPEKLEDIKEYKPIPAPKVTGSVERFWSPEHKSLGALTDVFKKEAQKAQEPLKQQNVVQQEPQQEQPQEQPLANDVKPEESPEKESVQSKQDADAPRSDETVGKEDKKTAQQDLGHDPMFDKRRKELQNLILQKPESPERPSLWDYIKDWFGIGGKRNEKCVQWEAYKKGLKQWKTSIKKQSAELHDDEMKEMVRKGMEQGNYVSQMQEAQKEGPDLSSYMGIQNASKVEAVAAEAPTTTPLVSTRQKETEKEPLPDEKELKEQGKKEVEELLEKLKEVHGGELPEQVVQNVNALSDGARQGQLKIQEQIREHENNSDPKKKYFSAGEDFPKIIAYESFKKAVMDGKANKTLLDQMTKDKSFYVAWQAAAYASDDVQYYTGAGHTPDDYRKALSKPGREKMADELNQGLVKKAKQYGKENALWLCRNADNKIGMQNEHTQNTKDAHTLNKVENKEKKTGKSELQDFMNGVVAKKQNKILQKNKEELQKQAPRKEAAVKPML